MAVPTKIVVSKIDVHVVKRARYATVVVTQTCLVKVNDHNITISYFEYGIQKQSKTFYQLYI